MMCVREYVYDVSLSAGVSVTQQAHGSQDTAFRDWPSLFFKHSLLLV